MDAAVVELDPLPNADGAAADDDGLPAGQGRSLVFLLVGAVVVGSNRLKLGGAGVHHLVHRTQVPALAQVPHLFGQHVGQGAHLDIGEAQPLGTVQQVRSQGLAQQPAFHVDYALHGADKPRVHIGLAKQFIGCSVAAQGGHHCPQPQVVRLQQALRVAPRFLRLGGGALPQQGAVANFQRARGLLQRGLEGTVDGHHLAGSLHLGRNLPVAVGEFVEGPAGNLHHAVVQGRLKGRPRLARNRVGNFVQPLAHGNFGGDPGDWVAGGLAGQGGAAADPGVHFDDVVVGVRFPVGLQRLFHPGVGPQGHLDIAAALNTQAANNLQAGRPEHLVLLVGQGLAGGHHDAVAGVGAHRIQVFHVADGDAVVVPVADNLVLNLLPTHQGTFQ